MNFLVFAEHRNGSFKKSSFEAVSAASKLAKEKGGSVIAVVLGAGMKPSAGILGNYGATKCLIAENAEFDSYSSMGFAHAIAEIASQQHADRIILSATSMGKDIAPRLAVTIEGVVVQDCTSLHWDGDALIARRPVYAGKTLIDVKANTANQVYTLRPNVFSAGEAQNTECTVESISVTISEKDFSTRVVETTTMSGKLDVAEANIIVSGGRGLQSSENFHLIESLAETLHAATGSSRAAVDAGWRPHAEQVGQTGKTVSPSLYIACGISGAIQHLAGMSSSKVIVAINKDKDAPIFQIADYGIVGDVFEVLPALQSELKKYFGN